MSPNRPEPFNVGRPATGSQFYGRARLIESIFRSRDWMWICGPRRMGKSSILMRLAQQPERSSRVVLSLDLGLYDGEPLDGELLFQELLNENAGKLLNTHDIQIKDFDGMKPLSGFRQLALRLLRKPQIQEVVFVWDEAEMLSVTHEIAPNLLNRLAATLRRIDGVQMVLAASQSLSELFRGEGEFLHCFQWVPLAGLENQAAQDLLRRAQTGGWLSPLPSDVVENAVQWSGSHPYLLQAVGAELARGCRDDGRAVSLRTLAKCMHKISQMPGLRNTIADDYSKLTPEQQRLLGTISTRDEGLTRKALASALHLSKRELDDALGFLQSYGYVIANGNVRLRFLFYGGLIPSTNGQSDATDAASVKEIRRSVFISYSHADRDYCDRFVKALRPRLDGRDIDLWIDRRIQPGDEWQKEIEAALNRAQVAVLLVSLDSLGSDFIARKEVPALLKAAKERGCRLLCMHVGPAPYEEVSWKLGEEQVSLAAFQALNSPAEPLKGLSANDLDRVLIQSANAVYDSLFGVASQ